MITGLIDEERPGPAPLDCQHLPAPPHAVVGGATYVAATRVAPGVIRHTGGQRLVLGELAGGTSTRTAHLQEALVAAGIEAEVQPAIDVALWEKFVVVAAEHEIRGHGGPPSTRAIDFEKASAC